jgi:cysteine synthase A
MPENMSLERINLMKAYGATVLLTRKRKGWPGRKRKRPNWGKRAMFSSISSKTKPIRAPMRRPPAKEIIADFPNGLDYFVAGVGTAGTLIGNAKVLKKHYPNIQTASRSSPPNRRFSKAGSRRPQNSRHRREFCAAALR